MNILEENFDRERSMMVQKRHNLKFKRAVHDLEAMGLNSNQVDRMQGV